MRRITCLLIIFQSIQLSAQDIQLQQFSFSSDQPSLSDIIKTCEEITGYFFAFNSNAVDIDTEVYVGPNPISLKELRASFKSQLLLDLILVEPNEKILLIPLEKINVYGVIRDSSSRETLPSVNVYTTQGKQTSSNDEGYFSFEVPADTKEIIFSFIGYRSTRKSLKDLISNNNLIYLTFDNELPFITIEDTIYSKLPEPIVPHDVLNSGYLKTKGINGQNDIISSIKGIPGVSVGSEAQTGFTVRGGGPANNLILIDGLPIYEISHLGGLSSIFIDKSIKKADFYKSNIPARYGGKLSSVLDIRLKDGNRNEYERQVNFSLENVSGFIEGPIGDKTALLFNARYSLFDIYASPLLSKFFNFQDSNFAYSDIYGKVSHWFNPSNRLSMTLVRTEDEVAFRRSDPIDLLSVSENNNINWGNSLYSLDWNAAMGSKVYLFSQLGLSKFRSRNSSATLISSDTTEISRLEILSSSSNENLTALIAADIYSNNLGVFGVGFNYTNHKNKPSIEEISSSGTETPFTDSTYVSDEFSFYLENKLPIGLGFTINSGVRFSRFLLGDADFFNVLPRINIQFQNKHNHLSVGYSKMNQFLHLLVNPSSGLPSDIWTPSTDSVPPEISDLYSLDYSWTNGKNLTISFGAFYNEFQNQLAYTNPTDILQAIVVDQSAFNWNTSTLSWEQRISKGSGRAYGVELGLTYEWSKWRTELAYTLSRSERTIDTRDRGLETFLYKYDRPHDLSLKLNYAFSKDKNLQFHFVYGNGNRWTIPEDQEELVSGGQNIFRANKRNNRQLSDFHHLDVNYSSVRKLNEDLEFSWSVGIYNIYNNRNPFYGYIKENPATDPEFVSLREVSLYPILPQCSFSLTW